MKHVPHALVALLLALGVAACATVPNAPHARPSSPGSASSSSSPSHASSSRRAASSAGTAYASPLGFSLELPAEAWIGTNATAPVTAFEDASHGRVFIATAAYDDPMTPEVDRLPTTLGVLRGANASWVPHWTMDVTPIADDAALAAWVKLHYGPGCAIAEQAPTAQDGVFDVLLEGDGLPLESTRCVLNFLYEIRYQPSAKRVLSWNLGQAPQFAGPHGEALDLSMRDSVRMR
jgi:hypothetical protein